MTAKRWLVALGLLVITLISTPLLADLQSDERAIDGLVRAQLADAQAQGRTWQNTEIVTSDYRFEGAWAFGMAVVKAPVGVHGEPDLRLFIAQRDAAGVWTVALQYTAQFYEWTEQIPDTLTGFTVRQALRSAGAVHRAGGVPRGDADARLSLPYATGRTWLLIGGPHGNNGDSARPWTSLDMNPDNNNT
ncbi:MAG: hypothetical protein H7Y11_15830, partial [Armatimonadetes bacterium]|nr:hypothetical protein [Anaerolineae bacterium]